MEKYPGCNCDQCPLREAGFVAPSGPIDSKILFIGQAPAFYEVRTGRPFSGPSGQVLDGSLATIGLNRNVKGKEDDIRADNTVLCFWKGGEGSPPTEAIKCCSGHIQDSIDRADIIVPMGNEALEAVIGQKVSVTKLSNTMFRVNGKIVLPLIHPAFYLHKSKEAGPEMFRDFLDGMKLLRNFAMRGEVPSEVPITVNVLDDAEEAILLLEELRNHPPEALAVDLETDQPDNVGGIITCVSLAYQENEAWIIPWNAEYLESHNSEYKPLLEYPEVFEALKGCLEAQPGILMHNAPFDARLLRREGIDLEVKDDTLLLHYALDERSTSQGLKNVARLYLGVPNWELDLKKYLPNKAAPFTLVPPDVLFKYAGKDSCYELTLKRVLSEAAKEEPGPKRLYENLLMPVNNMFIDQSMVGVRMDSEALSRALVEMPKRIAELEKELEEITGDRFFNPASPIQVREALKKRGVDIPDTRKERLESLVYDQDHELLPDADELIVKLLELRMYTKICNTYMMNFARGYHQGRGFPDLRLFGTVTGRLSGGSFNPLIMPRESRGGEYKLVKDIMIADEGCFLWDADNSGMELRGLAYLSGDEWLKKALSDPDSDFHSIMAEQIFGDKFKTANGKQRKELRVIAKMFVFGLNYGRGVGSIAAQLRCSVTEATELLQRYFAPMPKVVQWRKESQKQAVDLEYLESTMGRRRRFNLITGDNQHDIERQAINSPVQTICSDANLLTMLRIHNEMGPRVRPLWPVHDSILSNVMKSLTYDELLELYWIFRETPMQVLDTDLPFFIDVSVGHSWGSLELCSVNVQTMKKLSPEQTIINVMEAVKKL